jgi:hypothetical protein
LMLSPNRSIRRACPRWWRGFVEDPVRGIAAGVMGYRSRIHRAGLFAAPAVRRVMSTWGSRWLAMLFRWSGRRSAAADLGGGTMTRPSMCRWPS